VEKHNGEKVTWTYILVTLRADAICALWGAPLGTNPDALYLPKSLSLPPILSLGASAGTGRERKVKAVREREKGSCEGGLGKIMGLGSVPCTQRLMHPGYP
jgi:hypothetical protein